MSRVRVASWPQKGYTMRSASVNAGKSTASATDIVSWKPEHLTPIR